MKLAYSWLVLGLVWGFAANAAKLNCGPEFQRLTGILGKEEAAKAIGYRSLAEHGVDAEVAKLSADAAYAGQSPHTLREVATRRVRERVKPEDRERFDRAVLEIDGKRDFARVLEVFKDPAKHLGDAGVETSPLEDRLLSAAALKFLTKKGNATANNAHLADHVAALSDPKVALVLKTLGLRPEALVRNVLMHDLGKEYDQLPPHFKAFLESVYPLPKPGERDVNFLPRVIMSHEFGSMIVTEQLAREAGIPDAKIPRLLALFAHHNAGYDPKLPGFHFWVQPFAWKAFADAMNTQGVNVPTTYDAVLGTSKGGSPETIVLTAIDRATSLTLASQEKFTPVLLSQNKFTNDGVAGQFSANSSNVVAEVQNVLGKLEGRDAAETRKFKALEKTLVKFYEPDITRLNQLSREMPLMAKGEGAYADRPATSEEELKTSVVYKAKDGLWSRVTADGKVYQSRTGEWGAPVYVTPEGTTANPSNLLFARVINPEFGYQARVLPTDLIQ